MKAHNRALRRRAPARQQRRYRPAKFGATRSLHTAAADPRRDAVDELLLEDAYNLRKPVLGICYGLQSLNVFRAGSLIQHIPDFLPEELRTRINHEAGKTVAVAHAVEIERRFEASRNCETDCGRKQREGHDLSRADTTVKRNGALAAAASKLVVPVNSSHHQSADAIGNGLRVAARCPNDGIVEALEGTASDHFVSRSNGIQSALSITMHLPAPSSAH